MPDIFSLASDSDIFSGNLAYSSARSATTGTISGTTSVTNNAGITRFSARGGGNTCRINRLFLDFDTSGVSVAPSSATLKFAISSILGSNNTNLIAVKSDAFTGGSDALQSSDFNNIDISTPYTDEIDIESASNGDTIDATLNSDALSDIAANDNFRVALINHAHDFISSEPSDTSTRSVSITMTIGGSQAVKVSYVAGAAASGPANLTSLNGIAKASITNVNTIALGSITSINGVS